METMTTVFIGSRNEKNSRGVGGKKHEYGVKEREPEEDQPNRQDVHASYLNWVEARLGSSLYTRSARDWCE